MILKKKVAQLCKRSKGILLATAKDKSGGYGINPGFNYCPNCGAKMGGNGKDDENND